MRLTVVSLSPTISVVRVDRCQQQAYDADALDASGRSLIIQIPCAVC